MLSSPSWRITKQHRNNLGYGIAVFLTAGQSDASHNRLPGGCWLTDGPPGDSQPSRDRWTRLPKCCFDILANRQGFSACHAAFIQLRAADGARLARTLCRNHRHRRTKRVNCPLGVVPLGFNHSCGDHYAFALIGYVKCQRKMLTL